MSDRIYFKNSFEDYSQSSKNAYLDENGKIKDEFREKLEDYKDRNYEKLTTTLRSDIYQDPSVYTGCAGVALLTFAYSLKDDDHRDEWLMNALQYIDLDFSRLKLKKPSFFCGDAGGLALAIVISYKMGDRRPEGLPHYSEILPIFLTLGKACQHADTPHELLYGSSGYLFASLFINHSLGKEKISAEIIENTIQNIIDTGKDFAARNTFQPPPPLLWSWHNKIYLGAAHGVVGILNMLLRARKYVPENELQYPVRTTLDWLISQQFHSGNLPSSLGSTSGDRLVQWCHGAPGFVSLLLRAYKVYGDPKYLTTALRAAECVWERGLLCKGYSLCHGVSGNAYAFLNLYAVTGEQKHLYRACCFADWVLNERPGTQMRPPDRPASLFEGLAGRLYFIEDMLESGSNPTNFFNLFL